jgi:glycosyltransferase involved in cell wall biosynthesis
MLSTEDYKKKKIFFVVNVDWFFVSHRLPLSFYAISCGYDVFLLTRNTGYKDSLVKKGIKFIDIPFKRSGSNPIHEIKCIFLLYKFYRKYKPDVIHHVTLKASLLGCISSKLAGRKNVINAISGFGYNFTNERNGLMQRIIKVCMSFSFKNKHFKFILQNPDDILMIKKMHFTVDSNIHLIKGSGVNLLEYYFTPAPNNKILKILFPARILLDKGILEFIQAAQNLQNKFYGKIKFILAGDCDTENLSVLNEDELKKILVPNYIEWIGFQIDMISAYKEADIIVLPSYREGLPKALIEACAIGRPIITTDVPGCRECVINEFNGFLVAAKDPDSICNKLEVLISNSDMRKAFGINSRKLAEREFSIQSVIEKTFKIYDDLINRKKRN